MNFYLVQMNATLNAVFNLSAVSVGKAEVLGVSVDTQSLIAFSLAYLRDLFSKPIYVYHQLFADALV